jgi:hypothetical protein
VRTAWDANDVTGCSGSVATPAANTATVTIQNATGCRGSAGGGQIQN